MATPTVSLAQLSRIAGDGTLAVDPQSGRPAKTPIMKCCQCGSVASSQFQFPIPPPFNFSTFQPFNLSTRIGNIPRFDRNKALW